MEILNFQAYLGIRRIINDEPQDLEEDIVNFQQDGAPPHYALPVGYLLDEQIEGKWIGKSGAVELPAWSPDIQPV